jgi:regulator of RNase E activity RraB
MSPANQFPADENGQTLRAIAESGVDLTVIREVEFAHRAPDESSATEFAEKAAELGFEVEVYEPDEEALEEGDTDWDVICTHNMVPTHGAISQIEAELAKLARKHGCREDGWGFMT